MKKTKLKMVKMAKKKGEIRLRCPHCGRFLNSVTELYLKFAYIHKDFDERKGTYSKGRKGEESRWLFERFECPYCHRLIEDELVDKEYKKVKEYYKGVFYCWRFKCPFNNEGVCERPAGLKTYTGTAECEKKARKIWIKGLAEVPKVRKDSA